MRACFLTVAAAIAWFILSGPATAQEKNQVLEGAQKFCAAEYGDRLLGVTIDGENGFACRFAAVEKVATYKLAPSEPKPKWDLDEEDEVATSGAASAASVAAAAKVAKVKKRKANRKSRARAKLRKKRRYKRRAKARKRKRLLRKRRALRKKRDPFAEFMRKVRRAASRKRSSLEPVRKQHALTS